ncbi:heparanase-like [Prorops nasuta]|uniref:heparanase-like n=1 Tax=Prorops nasuta TaxID=863751 RepID=UPI0034D0221D
MSFEQFVMRNKVYFFLLFIINNIILLWAGWSLYKNIAYTQCSIQSFHLDTYQSILHRTNMKFLSVGLDLSLARNMKDVPIKNDLFIKLSKYLSPAFVRIGGTSADCLTFNETNNLSRKILMDANDISNFTITEEDFLNFYEFAVKAELQMIFDLNVLLRNPDGSWNVSNALNIINFARSHSMDIDWQLGNEPNSFYHVFNISISPEQLAKDYNELRLILNKSGYDASLLVGPEVNHIGDEDHIAELYLQTFLENDKDSIDFVTWHQYYLNGREATVNDFVNPKTFQYLSIQIKSVIDVIQNTGKRISSWISETSSAYGGGAPNLSDRFVDGFLWLDKLGYSAQAGIDVVTRQTLFGGNYALIGPDLEPNPSWWISVLYKLLVSEKVLIFSSPNDYLRFYAHCTSKQRNKELPFSVTIFGMNIADKDTHVSISGITPIKDKKIKMLMFYLTAENLQSRNIQLNGEVLRLGANGELPPLDPLIIDPDLPIHIPAYSISFIVLVNVDIPACA